MVLITICRFTIVGFCVVFIEKTKMLYFKVYLTTVNLEAYTDLLGFRFLFEEIHF